MKEGARNEGMDDSRSVYENRETTLVRKGSLKEGGGLSGDWVCRVYTQACLVYTRACGQATSALSQGVIPDTDFFGFLDPIS